MPTILITGASSGMGRDAAEYFVSQGWNVAATMRIPDRHKAQMETDRLKCLKVDVTDIESITQAVSDTLDHFGALDVVVNNAGYGIVGPMEGATLAQINRQIATNLAGPVHVMRAALPTFRAQKSGIFINVTSVGGRVAVPMNALYHMTKWGLEGLSESLAYELALFGIKMKIIEPGGTKTEFLTRSIDRTNADIDPAYRDLTDKITESFETRLDSWSPVEDVTQAIWQAATDGTDQLRYPVGDDAVSLFKLRGDLSNDEFMNIIYARYNLKS